MSPLTRELVRLCASVSGGVPRTDKFKKTAVNLIAFSLTPDKVAETLNVDMHVHAHNHECLSRVHCIQSHALSDTVCLTVQIRELKEAFMACDDNGDGVISFAEFKSVGAATVYMCMHT